MSQQLTQEERLDRLVEEFKADSGEYKDIETPKDKEILVFLREKEPLV